MSRKESVLENQQMRVSSSRNGFCWCGNIEELSQDEPTQDESNSRMAHPHLQERSPIIPWIRQLLSTLCPKLF
jgi:hypothetical protein